MLLVTSCSDDDKVPDGYFLKESLTDVFIMPKEQANGSSANYNIKIQQIEDIIYIDIVGKYVGPASNKKLFYKLLD